MIFFSISATHFIVFFLAFSFQDSMSFFSFCEFFKSSVAYSLFSIAVTKVLSGILSSLSFINCPSWIVLLSFFWRFAHFVCFITVSPPTDPFQFDLLSLSPARSLCIVAGTPRLAAMPADSFRLPPCTCPPFWPAHSTGTCVINIPMIEISQTPPQHTQLHVLQANKVEKESKREREREGERQTWPQLFDSANADWTPA